MGKTLLIFAFSLVLAGTAPAQDQQPHKDEPRTACIDNQLGAGLTYAQAKAYCQGIMKRSRFEKSYAHKGFKQTLLGEQFFLKPASVMTEDKARSLFEEAAKKGDRRAKADLEALDRYAAMKASPVVQALENIWNSCVRTHLSLGQAPGPSTARAQTMCKNNVHSCGREIIPSDASIRSAAMLDSNPFENLTPEDVMALDACMAQRTQDDLSNGHE